MAPACSVPLLDLVYEGNLVLERISKEFQGFTSADFFPEAMETGERI